MHTSVELATNTISPVDAVVEVKFLDILLGPGLGEAMLIEASDMDPFAPANWT